ncbi:hypothetical protein E4U42_004981 [Claviceps africana]|uniref:Uncharacterized protein n=1 Tax=Claviceps africana TaxID=83212 RepID=A0A8K0NKE6_9HYPO|nr:hypothetical protein E4U42_004981 [Claviceps africana]
MLSSPSRTSTKGHNDFCTSSERAPGLTGGALSVLAKTTVSALPAAPPTAASDSRPGCSETSSSSVGDNDEPLSSWTSNYTPETLRTQHRVLSLTGDKMSTESPESSSSRPGAWHMRRNKNNADQHPENQHSATAERTPTQLRLSSTPATASTSLSVDFRISGAPSPRSSRFSFFNIHGFKGLTTATVSVPSNDELINLNIDAALSSAGTIQTEEPSSPAAFNNLHTNAANLLRKFQSAYQDKAIACQELRAERDLQQDEKLELETRVTCLKIQLDDMAQKAAEAEVVMQALMQELNQEKKLRLQERAARESLVLSSGISTISEDLGAEDDQRRNHHRRSASTMKSDDAGFDTDEESIDQISLFSRSRSPPLVASPLDGLSTHSGLIASASHVSQAPRSNMLEPPRSSRQSQPQQISTFQKLMKGISGDATKKESTCQNCQGQDASMAWDTAGLLRDENRGLKQRVSDLEAAIEGALDAVMGVQL